MKENLVFKTIKDYSLKLETCIGGLDENRQLFTLLENSTQRLSNRTP